MFFEPNWEEMRKEALEMGIHDYVYHKIKRDIFIDSNLENLYPILICNINEKMKIEYSITFEEFKCLVNEIKSKNNPTYNFKRVYDEYHEKGKEFGAYEIEINFLGRQFLLKSVTNGSDLKYRTYISIDKDDENYEFEIYNTKEYADDSYSIFLIDNYFNLNRIVKDIYFGTKKENKTYKLPTKKNKKRLFFS